MKNNFDLKNFLVENKLTINSRQLNEDLISKIRSAVQGPEADAIFKAAQEFLDDEDAEDMGDALSMAADQYIEYYESTGNEDGVEVAKYIMRSIPIPKSNVQDFSKLKDLDPSKWVSDSGLKKS